MNGSVTHELDNHISDVYIVSTWFSNRISSRKKGLMTTYKRPSFVEGITKDITHKDGTVQNGLRIPTKDPSPRGHKTNLTKGAFGK